MKNSLEDLNNYLFGQIEALSDPELSDEQLEREIKKAEGISKLGGQIVANAKPQFDAIKLRAEYEGLSHVKMPALLEGNKDA